MKRVCTVTALGLIALTTACQSPPETPQQAQARMDTESAAAKTVIDSVNGEFTKHFNMGHAAVVAGFYAEQAHVMPPNDSAAVGHAAIQAALGGLMPMNSQLTLTAQAVVANGPLAVERGVYSITFTPPGAKAPMTDHGKHLRDWHRVDGKWLIADDIWNSDLPPMPMAPAPKPTKSK